MTLNKAIVFHIMIIVVRAVFHENDKYYLEVFLHECLHKYRRKRNKNIICETKNFYILLAFLLITIALLIAVSVCCCMIKYKAKQKHLLPFYVTNN